jgi:nucleotide-binding universal stress UspA family protein
MASGPVLFGYDGSPDAREAITRAGALLRPGPAVVATTWLSFAEAAPAALLAVPGGVAREGAEMLDEAECAAAEELAAEGAALARGAGFEASPRALPSRGPSWPVLVALADELDAAAIVLGSRGRSAMAAAVLGGVSTGVLHHTRRPVLVVRPGP